MTLTSIGLTNHDGKNMTVSGDGLEVPVLLDSGTTYTYIPPKVYRSIAKEIGAQYISSTSVVPCALRDYNGTLNFGFSGFEIQIPFRELVIDAFDIYGDPITFSSGEDLCFFGVFPEEGRDHRYVLGDTFLRGAYVVYDLDNAEISLANVKFNATNRFVLLPSYLYSPQFLT